MDAVLDRVEDTREKVRQEIGMEFATLEVVRGLEQQMKHLKNAQGDINGRMNRVEKNLEEGVMNNDIQNDLSQLKKLSYSIGQINDTFKEDVFRLESKLKDNSMRLLEFENNMTTTKSDFDQKHSKLVWENSEQSKKILYLEELFNEMFEVIKKHNMQNEISQQNNKSRPDLLSASYYSKASDCGHTREDNSKSFKLEIYDKFTQLDQGLFNCLGFIKKEQDALNCQDHKHKELAKRVGQIENEMNTFQDHLQNLLNKQVSKHQRKSSSKRQDLGEVEIMINNQISKNLKKFSEVLNNMLNNYENKIEDID